MKIVVCVKHVPDIQADRRFTESGLVDRTGGDGTINELDENALEAAVSLVESLDGDDHEIVVLSVGPADAEDAVRRGLQMGAQTGVLVSDDAIEGSDVFATAALLAAAIRQIGEVDLVVTGMAALDSLTSLLPSTLAAALDLPALTLASSVTLADGTVTVTRSRGQVSETLSAALPALVSVTDQANAPRYPNFKMIMAARKAPVTTLTVADLTPHGLEPAALGLAGARSEVLEAAPRPAREDRVLVHDDGTAASRLVAYLAERSLL